MSAVEIRRAKPEMAEDFDLDVQATVVPRISDLRFPGRQEVSAELRARDANEPAAMDVTFLFPGRNLM